MPAAAVTVGRPSGDIPLTTLLTEVVVSGPGIDVVYINADDDIYVTFSPTLSTGDAIPPERFRVPAGISHPFRLFGWRLLIAARTGTTTAWVVAPAAVPVDVKKKQDPCT